MSYENYIKQLSKLDNADILSKLANMARNVFESHITIISYGVINTFPKGACGFASDFFGTWLIKEMQMKNVELVKGTRQIHGCKHYEEETHNWLKVDDLVVDVTSDQFLDGVGPVFVDTSSKFHMTFCTTSGGVPYIGQAPRQGDFEKFIHYMALEINKRFF